MKKDLEKTSENDEIIKLVQCVNDSHLFCVLLMVAAVVASAVTTTNIVAVMFVCISLFEFVMMIHRNNILFYWLLQTNKLMNQIFLLLHHQKLVCLHVLRHFIFTPYSV